MGRLNSIRRRKISEISNQIEERINNILIQYNFETRFESWSWREKINHIQNKKNLLNTKHRGEWSENYLYPILPKLNKFGVFDDDVNVETSYGNASIAPITNIDETDNNLLLDVDFNQNDTDDLIDKTDINKIEYNQDFQLSLDENLRLKIDTLIIPDGIETEESEQAF